MRFYSLKNILATDSIYNIIVGERSNGKTYSVLKYAVSRYVKTGEQLAIIRRWGDDFNGKGGAQYFENLVSNDVIRKLTGGKYSGVKYRSQRWYLIGVDEKGESVQDETPIAFAFSFSGVEHDKSSAYPNVTTIFFDEFIPMAGFYFPNEFIIFANTLSTIIRHRNNVKIFMVANTVSWSCPYFKEMGLKNVRKMKPGTIDTYRYGNSELKVSVEYCSPTVGGKPSDVYFAFDNPKLKMITGGAWEIAVYPHLPVEYVPKDVLFTYYIEYDDMWLCCKIVSVEDNMFTFIYPQTSPPDKKTLETSLIYTPDFSPRPNYRRKLTKPRTDVERKIVEFFIRDKVFYATNETGEIVRNYLEWCNH